ncbi:hypothetical protein V5O48_017889 [Marasmius crinis-equi]|uniref:Uncharacterized protein n=1 Tax=Marasmius crinis-equi TaxID=585013 RepID=A0ABR3EMR8_9AGAR
MATDKNLEDTQIPTEMEGPFLPDSTHNTSSTSQPGPAAAPVISTSTNTASTPTAQTEAEPPVQIDKPVSEDVENESSEEELSATTWKRGSRGNPGIWKPKQIAFFDSKLEDFRSKSGTEQTAFMKGFDA